MNPLFRIDFSISDSLKIVRKSVLIYETIILGQADAGHEKGAKKKSHPPTDVIFSINKIHFYIETELFLTDSCASPKNFRLHCTSLNA